MIEKTVPAAALQRLRLAYVNLMECGRDRIVMLGGSCDPVDVMEAGDPALRAADAILAAALTAAPQVEREEHPDDLAVDRFAAAMKAKLAEKRAQGYGGWEKCYPTRLSDMLIRHVFKGDPVDVGNFAMMIHQVGGRVSL